MASDDVPPCAAAMGCLCAGHARGNPADAPCDTTEVEAACIESAIELLASARRLLVKAGAPKTAERVRLALTSARGALSNARYREHRPERKRIKRAPRVEVRTIK